MKKVGTKIGVLGGTFDPVHNGHLAIAGEARERLGLDKILFVPAGCPWLRSSSPRATTEQRAQMVELAINGAPYYRLSTVEVQRPAPSCSADTVTELKSRLKRGDELFFILGWDNLAELPKWREPGRLIKMCRLVAVPRPGYALPDLKELEHKIPGLAQRVILLDAPHLDIHASGIRRRVARGLSISHLVPQPVAEYIREQGLYANID